MSDELNKAIALLETIKSRIIDGHNREVYFATMMVVQTLPEISRLLQDIKS